MKNTSRILPLFFVLVGLFMSYNSSAQLRILKDNALVNKGETHCMDLVVENFDDLIVVTFALQWDPTVLEFKEVANLAPIVAPGDFGQSEVGQGKLSFQWFDAGEGKSLPDGQILYSICFEAIGDEGDASKVRLVGTESDPPIEILDKDGNSLNPDSPDAEIEIQFETAPENSVFLYYDDVIITEGASFCIPIRVRNFEAVDLLQFALDFNDVRLQYDQISFREENGGNWFVFVDQVGENIRYQGFDNSFAGGGISIDDGDRLFEICFTHILEETCVFEELFISSQGLTIEASKNDESGTIDVPVIFEPGKIRLRNAIDYIGEDIVPVTCRDQNIGSITVNATGGTDGIKYLWSTGETTSTISNLVAGVYDVSISDVCLAVDTIFRTFEVPLSGSKPTASAVENIEWTCGQETILLDGSGSSNGSNITYSWRGIDGQSILSGEATNQATVNEDGRYELVVLDTDSGCSAVDTTTVIDTRVLPDIMAGEDVRLGCNDPFITLNGTGSSGVNFEYEWTTVDGRILDRISKGGITVDTPGTYTFRITDLTTGCIGVDELIVSGGNIIPELGIVGMTNITCTDPQLSLEANTDLEAGISYTWTTSDGSIVSGASDFTVVLDAPGRYQVNAENDESGCMTSDAVIIVDRRTTPVARAGDDAQIDCDVDDITLVGTGNFGSAYQYSWSTNDGNIVSQTSDGEAIVNSSGTYTFTVLEIANGCSTTDDVLVQGDNEKPQASISGGTTLDCITTSLQLNANNGGGAVTGFSYEWSTDDGSFIDATDQVWAPIDQPGTYTVKITNEGTGCSNNATVTVNSVIDEPSVSVGNDLIINCSDETRTLSGNSDNMANEDFQWNIVGESGQIISTTTNAQIEVMGPGTYEVIVTNRLNGCSTRDTVMVSLNAALPLAEVGMDYDHCEAETILMGNQEGQVTGMWTVIAGSAVLEDPNDRNCRVNSLSEGTNSFVWTLSANNCANYSSDTININLVPEPVAMDDQINVNQGFGSVDIELLNNDQFSRETGATINLSSQPSLGVLTENGNGQFTYTLDNPNAFGSFTFDYEICDDLCSLNCDIGTVTIDVRDGDLPPINQPATNNEPLSLGITPNGDGLNDQLVFDELLENSNVYATKRLIVYNRWGDIVHEAQPYNNDWGGTNKGGSLLPQGTYYFVMQLDLGRGAIIEGDVTILQ